MKLSVDSSSFAKRYVQEIGSEELERFLGDADLFITSDRRQFMAAKNSGLHAEYIGQPVVGADL